MGGATQANAGLYKNNAAIKKTEAANQWSYFQSKSTKQNLSELALELSPGAKKEFYESEIKRYKQEKAEIKVNAEKLEALSQEWDQKSDEQMHQHHRWAQAMALSPESEPLWVIGGAEVYAQALPLASTVVVTEIDIDVQGDAHAPHLGAEWIEMSRQLHSNEGGLGYSFVTYTK